MKSKKIVIANWKMNPETQKEAIRLFLGVKEKAIKLRNIETVVCPPDIFLQDLIKESKGKKINIGAQDVSLQIEKAHTGEVSAKMLSGLGVSSVIVGHSERREAGETDEEVAKKIELVLKNKMNVILCVGEKERNEGGIHLAFVARQIETALESISKKSFENIIIAYEPIWAIGKSGEDAIDSHSLHSTSLFIKKVLVENYGKKLADKVRIIYGGSVEEGNAEDLITNGNIDGFLVGHESLNPTKFNKILEIVNRG